ncbi:MAG: CBS domain-containing protein [Deltaproteobacteria bacterium]|nr:CBS domain-containing protein [Deltaproteobacteria bacterium]
MEVITSHTNADFDTFASMIAAKKLYPRARLVFSGSLEKSLKNALETISLPYKFDRIKEIKLDQVKRLILVDVRQAGRIGPFGELAKKPGIDIHIYDHHPSTEEDIQGSLEVIKPYGSSTTVLTLILKERAIPLTPEEATILMAGIYEDTGSLTYPSTTASDYEAASFLLSNGADLPAVSALLRKELTPEEVALLNEFLQSETTYTVSGLDIVVAEGYLEKYTGDISTLAHKIMDIESMSCLFMLVDTEDRVHVIARSRAPRVDVGKVARAVGGGGHSTAASATIKGATLIEAKEILLSAIRKSIVPERAAKDIMSFPPITLPPQTRLNEAIELMRRYGINAAPVVRNGSVSGVITRQVLDKAVYHGLGSAPVEDYMTTEIETVTADTSVDEIREKVVGHGQRLLPVLKDKKVAGVITRTDLLKLLQEELREASKDKALKVRHLSKLIQERLPAWAVEILKDAGGVAEASGLKAYAVGGFVRDLILRRENLDIDIVIEGGDGIAFATDFAGKRGLRVKTHHRFRTAVLIFPDGFKIDVATARLEYYEKPAALPTVEQSSLKLDLYRRDFIINTLAIALCPGKFGELIDFFGAQKDIKEKTIRVLHNLSFVEDPTRALRAARFAEKFDFKISKHTLHLIKNAVKLDVFKELSGARLLEELKNILKEETAAKCIKRLHELGLLKLIHGSITWDLNREIFFERTRETLIWHELLYTKDKAEGWLVLLLALTDPLTEEDLKGLVKRLMISGKKKISVLDSRGAGIKALNMLNSGLVKKNSSLYSLLDELPIEVIIYLLAKAQREHVKRSLSNYITKLKYTETALKGADVKKMGVEEGPVIGEILRELFNRRLDGELLAREDEERFVRDYVSTKKRQKDRRAAKKN